MINKNPSIFMPLGTNLNNYSQKCAASSKVTIETYKYYFPTKK